jgi:RNA polymerase sigma-70 factor (ECF subfamily)
LQEAINKLSPAYKAVFNLYVLEDYTHKEIAEILGISEGTSKSNLSKAKMNLQKILKEKFMNID